MKGDWSSFSSSGSGDNNSNGSETHVNGKDYNTAGSRSVKRVDSVQTVANVHSMPTESTPNSVTRNYKAGKLNTERYYDGSGKAYLDIDYSDHGNPTTHPYVPHEHDIHYDSDGKLHRGKARQIKND